MGEERNGVGVVHGKVRTSKTERVMAERLKVLLLVALTSKSLPLFISLQGLPRS